MYFLYSIELQNIPSIIQLVYLTLSFIISKIQEDNEYLNGRKAFPAIGSGPGIRL